MIPKELFQKVRQIEITTSRLVSDVFAGQYHSVFKGQGIEFDEVREYQIGDDIRTIDWNVTARTGKPHVKKFVEERELTVMILVDVSQSCRFGTVEYLKSQLAAEISALLALSAIRNNDKVGLMMFTDRVEKFIPPRKNIRDVLRLIREVLYFNPEGKKTDIIATLEHLNKVMPRKAIVFLISDYFDRLNISGPSVYEDRLKKTLTIVHKRHDLIAITLNDPREYTLEDCGILLTEDTETGEFKFVDTSDKKSRDHYRQVNQNRRTARKQLFKSIGMDFVDVATDGSYADEMVKFFLKRRHRLL